MGLFDLARPFVFAFPPEKAHSLSIRSLKAGILPTRVSPPDPRLEVTLAGLRFPNPVGLAAGYDKNAEVPDEILKLGFGFCEVGTITPLAQPGNPKPRVFRLVEDKALINRLGFNNEGHEAALRRLKARAQSPGIVGVNIGANKDSADFVADYEKGIDAFYEVASYFTANISSPNTPGLRNLQAGKALTVLLERIFERVSANSEKTGRTVPVFLKIAPDLEEDAMDEIAEVVKASQLSAVIVSNTTLDRSALQYKRHANEAGGLSGAPLFEKSTRVLAKMHKRLGKDIPLIGVGGVASAKQAIAKIEAGASLVQLYTGMVYAGPNLPSDMVRDISRYLDQTKTRRLTDLVGVKTTDWL
ncbi:MAG: quinone-dependent dihydroorotate dehydrogenase [Pseudomonadota bacterium]